MSEDQPRGAELRVPPRGGSLPGRSSRSTLRGSGAGPGCDDGAEALRLQRAGDEPQHGELGGGRSHRVP